MRTGSLCLSPVLMGRASSMKSDSAAEIAGRALRSIVGFHRASEQPHLLNQLPH